MVFDTGYAIDEMSRHLKISYKFLCNQNLGIQVQEETFKEKQTKVEGNISCRLHIAFSLGSKNLYYFPFTFFFEIY